MYINKKIFVKHYILEHVYLSFPTWQCYEVNTALFNDLPVEYLHNHIHVIKRDGREMPQQNIAYQWQQEELKTNHTRYTLYI